jgi:hypothetical protein
MLVLQKTLTSSSDLPFLGGSFLNSSESPNTRFMCRSYAMNLQAQQESIRRVLLVLLLLLLLPSRPRCRLIVCTCLPHICLPSVSVTRMR